MTPEQLFSLSGMVAMVGWAGLVLLPQWKISRDWIAPIVAPLLIAVLYTYLLLANMGQSPADGGFGSLAAVSALFTVDELLLAGWVHYLAFDLFVGAWEVRDSQARGIHHLLVVPCLLATFMAGPAGLLLYWILCSIHGLRRDRRDMAAT